jgi:DNA mismatch endonuclease Vsr
VLLPHRTRVRRASAAFRRARLALRSNARGRVKRTRTDNVDELTRSAIMRAIKNRRVRSTELALRARLARAGVRGWRMYAADLPGTPDFAFDVERLAIFVDGCFWHGCPYCYRRPQSNRTYWDAKVQRNRARDSSITQRLRRTGWSVCRLWQCELHDAPGVLTKLSHALVRSARRHQS